MRINTGRWGTISRLTTSWPKRGSSPPWTVTRPLGIQVGDRFARKALAPRRGARRCPGPGKSLGARPHGGRRAKIVEAIKSPWLQITLDTGNFLENSYEQLEMMASAPVPLALVQAKTYYGGGAGMRSTSTMPGSPASCGASLPRLDFARV